MHISHDFIATKTCPSYEFLVVFGQVQVRDRKSAVRGPGWDGLRGGCKSEVCGAGAGRFLKLAQGGFKFCWCGAGADKKFQPV